MIDPPKETEFDKDWAYGKIGERTAWSLDDYVKAREPDAFDHGATVPIDSADASVFFRCAKLNCRFQPHSSGALGGYCCSGCHGTRWMKLDDIGKGAAEHGSDCEQKLVPPGSRIAEEIEGR